MKQGKATEVMRQLIQVWAEFDTLLNKVPIIDKINRKKITMDDYQMLLLNHRQQVIEGASWITRAASNISPEFIDIRSSFINHAALEQHDYKMLEESYYSVGGTSEELLANRKNIGSEALSAWMYYKASQKDPFDLIGAMFIIEGLGKNKAGSWATLLMQALDLNKQQVEFYLYHHEHDQEHINEMDELLESGILDIENMSEAIVKTAKVTGRLYLLQLQEIGNF